MSHVDDLESSAAPLIEHLKELRYRILMSLSAFLAGVILCFIEWQPIWTALSHPICNALAARGEACTLNMIRPQDGFFVTLRLAMWAGFVLSFPVIAFQLWRFVAPGLYKNEKGAFLPFLLASPIMFCLGGIFAYYGVMPLAFNFFLSYQDQFNQAMEAGNTAPPLPKGLVFTGSLEAFFSLTMQFILAFGLCFQLPVLLTLLGKAGIIGSKGLKATRKYAIVGIMLLSSMIAPPDVTSMLILFAVIYPLYEASIWIIVVFERQREAQEKADGTWQEPDGE